MTSLRTEGPWFIDREGRKVLLRGVNLGGSTKVPAIPNGATHIKTDFTDHRDVSFIGRPFPEADASEHLERLKHWGFNCLRFLITWEAIEHSGPGEYDLGYLAYLQDMIRLASDLGFSIYIDPHQDVWSRMTGGDGAPGWLFEKVGLDFTKFDATDAALVMQYRYPEDYPRMSWSGNYFRFAAATMFTLFFGGKDFAPGTEIDGVQVQEYLQSHYIDSIKQVAIRCKEIENVIGYGSMNEPSHGFIGHKDITKVEGYQPPGLWFTPLQAMATASGCTMTIPIHALKWFNLRKVGEKTVNPTGESCWLPGAADIWQENGVWGLGDDNKPSALHPGHFSKNSKGRHIAFFQDYLRPFVNRFAEELRTIDPEAIIFVENEPMSHDFQWTSKDAGNIVNADHWYDFVTLYTRKFMRFVSVDILGPIRLAIGPQSIRKMFKRQLGGIKLLSEKAREGGGIPTLIGEFGIPYDMNKRIGYTKGDFSAHEKALSWNYEAMDHHLLNCTQWNYTADNCNDWGDLWNQEDLSIFSRDQQRERSDVNIHSGGRAVRGFCRPYVQRTAGTPMKMVFDLKKGEFTFVFTAAPTHDTPTEIFVPTIQYPHGYTAEIAGGKHEVKKDEREQLLRIYSHEPVEYTISLRRTR